MSSKQTTKHVGIILDGNRRWAKTKGKSVLEGHQAGYETLKSIVRSIKELHITHLSAYVFSTENWSRSKEEVDNLMDIFRHFAAKDIDEIHEQNVRVQFIGSSNNVPTDLLQLMRDAEVKTNNNTDGTLIVCFNYGGQLEIAEAATALIQNNPDITEITPEMIAQHLYAPELPPVDLVIRTSGEKRLSNFMLWRAAYAEFAFTDTFWPDFTSEEFAELVREFEGRSRRFGA